VIIESVIKTIFYINGYLLILLGYFFRKYSEIENNLRIFRKLAQLIKSPKNLFFCVFHFTIYNIIFIKCRN